MSRIASPVTRSIVLLPFLSETILYVRASIRPSEILKPYIDNCFRLPMTDNVRSLNLSNCVALVLFEVLRQQDYPNLSKVETIKGEDYLEN